MGQAMVDLPDPLETPRATSLGPDDLLAQMAGEEIDRLLAEAEAETPPVRRPPHSVIEDELSAFPGQEAFTVAKEQPVSTEAPSAAVPPSPVDPLAGELDSLLESLTAAQPPAPVLAPAPADALVGPVEPEQSPALIPVAEAAVSSGEAAALFSAPAQETVAADTAPPLTFEDTTAAERSALAAGESPARGSALADAPSSDAEAAASEQLDTTPRLPRWLLPLEWINAPLAACPDLLREFIGKAAVLTALNALAVIFYVRFIRRH